MDVFSKEILFLFFKDAKMKVLLIVVGTPVQKVGISSKTAAIISVIEKMAGSQTNSLKP